MLLEKGIRIVVNEQVKIYSERIDDLAVIVEWLKKMEIGKWIDQKLSPPHGNHEGMSYGQLSVLLLTYIITQSDHRLSAVEPWVEAHVALLVLSIIYSQRIPRELFYHLSDFSNILLKSSINLPRLIWIQVAIAHYHTALRLPFHVLKHVTPCQRFLAPWYRPNLVRYSELHFLQLD
jgi:hypothetical protein